MQFPTINQTFLKSSALLLVLMTGAHSLANEYDGFYDWVDKPWPARYVISVAPYYSNFKGVAAESNERSRKKGSPVFWMFEEFFDATYPFKEIPRYGDWVTGDMDDRYGEFGFQVMEFDSTGKVLTPNRAPKPLQIRHLNLGPDWLYSLMVEGDASVGNPFYTLGHWIEYLPGNIGKYLTPALCGDDDVDRYGIVNNDIQRNSKNKFDVKNVINSRSGAFGCREWAYQMKRPISVAGLGGQVPDAKGQCQGGFELGLYKGKLVCPGLDEGGAYKPNAKGFVQPYIDVTTYHDKAGKKTHIGRFIGWMGFGDAPRPVIGKHGDYWLCLHECPAGEKPGVIADIADWTAKRGWPLPKPTPYFPDSKLKSTKADWME